MATLENLPNPRFLRLTDVEKFEMVRNIRTRRRIRVEKVKREKVKQTTKQSKKTSSAKRELAHLNPSELLKLMELLNAD